MLNRYAVERTAESGTTSLRVSLLGQHRVAWDGQSIAIPRRQARGLFYYLAARLRPASRDELISLFWPDLPEIVARRNLTRILTQLRLALPIPEVLLACDDQVELDAQLIWSDGAAFERLRARPGARRLTVALRQAVELYRGPFLAGFCLSNSPEFDRWLTLERSAWERLYLETLEALVEDSIANEEYEAATGYVRRYLAADELSEGMHRRLIELYAAAGDRGAALRHFERCAAILQCELGVSPLPETLAVRRAILEGRVFAGTVLTPKPAFRQSLAF